MFNIFLTYVLSLYLESEYLKINRHIKRKTVDNVMKAPAPQSKSKIRKKLMSKNHVTTKRT